MSSPEFLDLLERAMHEAYRLGLYRTAHQLHETGDLARYEQQEVAPEASGRAAITWRIGPIREQS